MLWQLQRHISVKNLHNLCKNFPFRRDETKSQHLDQGGSNLSRELESSTFKLGFSSAEKAKDEIGNLNLYLDYELIQSLLAFLFTYRYHQAGLRMLVLMSYNKPLCDMCCGIMNLFCADLVWVGNLFKCWEVKGTNAPQLSNFVSEII